MKMKGRDLSDTRQRLALRQSKGWAGRVHDGGLGAAIRCRVVRSCAAVLLEVRTCGWRGRTIARRTLSGPGGAGTVVAKHGLWRRARSNRATHVCIQRFCHQTNRRKREEILRQHKGKP